MKRGYTVPAHLVATISSSRLPRSCIHRPMKRSLSPVHLASGGTGYISAESRKLPPRPACSEHCRPYI